jgi:REP element-mobilizing transposase RayT
MVEQIAIRFPQTWGGMRPGAGRPKGTRRSERMPHTPRSRVSRHVPHHVTVRVARGTWNLRSQRCFAPVRAALAAVRRRPDFRVVHFSVQHNHLHLVTEAESRRAMSNGLRALLIRVARGLNRVMRTRGKRFADRYHEHVLATPTEVRNALRYVVGNRFVHLARWGTPAGDGATDEFSSLVAADLVTPPMAWLLREGWTRAGPWW